MAGGKLKEHSATYQDVLSAPAHMVAEIINGALHAHPRPAPRHSHAYSVLGAKIGGPFHFDNDGPGGWWILDEPELHLGPDVLVPDIAGWRRERMPNLPDTAYFETVPDWVCEILSNSTREYDLTAKRDIYAREAVTHLWLVDPDAHTLEAFDLTNGKWLLIANLHGDEQVSVPPFDAISFSLGALWP